MLSRIFVSDHDVIISSSLLLPTAPTAPIYLLTILYICSRLLSQSYQDTHTSYTVLYTYAETPSDTRRLPQIRGDSLRYTETPSDTRRLPQIHGDSLRCSETPFRVAETPSDARRLPWMRGDSAYLRGARFARATLQNL